jgi:hypothetical protein
VLVLETKAVSATVPLSAAEVTLLAHQAVDSATKMVAVIQDRLAVVEARALVPGPPGQNGRDGVDGAAGVDGLGFDDLDVTFDGDRTLLFKFVRGTQEKVWPIALPFLKQQGVYQEGQAYVPGDVVTWAGSAWHCTEATHSKPGDGSKAWTLIVKRGRDGRDGRDAPGPVPVVSLGRG